MFTGRLAKFMGAIALGALAVLPFASFSADPSFSITPASGTELKLHCLYDFGIVISPGGQSYNAFNSTLSFDHATISLWWFSVNPFFSIMATGYINGLLYRTYGGVTAGSSSSSVLTAANFILSTTQNILSTSLHFTTRTWGDITFDPNTTDDGATINSSISSLDILAGVTDAGYTFVPRPCIIDTDPPSDMNISPTNGTTNISTWYTTSFIVYDWKWAGNTMGTWPLTGNDRNHYRYSGLDMIDLNNYQKAPITVDNQEWVNSGSIKVDISCPSCAWARSYSLSWSSLTIIAREGNSSINRYTRDNADRGYRVSFPAPMPNGYEVEKQVTMHITWADMPNELGATHTSYDTLSFNAPVPPTITLLSPTSGAAFIDPNFSPIVLFLSDAWAWIDTWSIKITIPAIYSWINLLYTGKTYSWNDLTLLLSWGHPWLGNSWSYQISLLPSRPFPDFTWIRITGYVSDLAGNGASFSQKFTTRPGCSYFWCSTIFGLNILGGLFSWDYAFSGSLIKVIGTHANSPYPYLTWTDANILMCGIPSTWTILTWNMNISSPTGAILNGIFFTWDKLYITWSDGLKFILSWYTILVQ